MSPVGVPGAAVSDLPAPEEAGEAGHRERPDRRMTPAKVAALMLAIVGLPFVVAAVTLRRPPWYPVLDLAMTELRLRDVGTSHTPLIGLPGRIGPSLAEQGSHPGPLSFYLLAPLYRLFGSSAWAMQVGTAVLDLVALGAALAIGARRGGSRLVVAVAALLTLLVAGYGLVVLSQPWNPYLPLLWWVVFLLAVWSVACDDLAMLPIAVVAGSLCAQTHVPYLGLVLGLGVVVVVAVVRFWRAPEHAGREERRRAGRWVIGAAALGVLLWLPPVVDQVVNDPGNGRVIYDHLVTPSGDEDPVGLSRGAELAVAHVDVLRLVGSAAAADGELLEASSDIGGISWLGLVGLAGWLVAAGLALRHGPRALVRLHLVVAVGLVLGLVAMSRILGKEWYYLMLWAWGLTALLLLAVGWSVVALGLTRLSAPMRRRAVDVVTAGLLVVVVVGSLALVVKAVDLDPPEPHLSATLGAVVPDTIEALERGEGTATGRDGRYTVAWDDPLFIGSQAYGLVSELERAGFEAGTSETWHVPITDHRVIEPEEATAALHFVTGEFVERWREVPEAVEVAYVEPRNAGQRAEFADLRSSVIEALEGDGQDELVPLVDGNLFGLSIDVRISTQVERLTERMLELGQPTAVFVAPPGTTL
jgi:hypothetical protein